jgi:hypothetical protein
MSPFYIKRRAFWNRTDLWVGIVAIAVAMAAAWFFIRGN